MIDYGALILVLVLTVAFCVPFVYMHHKKKQHEKKLISDFMAKSKEFQLQISSYDLWRRTYILGIDKLQMKLLYIKFGEGEEVMLLDLTHFVKVHILDEVLEVGTGKQKEKIVCKLWLAFQDVNPTVQDTLLEFYNSGETFGLLGEPLLIKKWSTEIQGLLDKIGRQAIKKEYKQKVF